MANSDWEKQTHRLDSLREQAEVAGPYTNVVDWLKDINVIPRDVAYVKPVPAKLDLDPSNVRAGYLAASAFEWDSWGESHPEDFIDALMKEVKGAKARDLIAGTLTLLGRDEEAVRAAA